VEGKPVSNVPDLDANKAIARKFLVCRAAGAAAALLSIYGDDFTCWTAGSLPFSGTHPRNEIAAMVNGVTSVFPKGWRFTVRALTAEGERVAVEAECLGEHVSGKTYEQKYHFLFVIRERKIREMREYFDTQHANEVLCSAPAPGFNS
jgi:ketosteroid isomerase-like protein